MRNLALLAALALASIGAAACGDDGGTGDSTDAVRIEDPGPVHVHGLGVNLADGALFIATHTGLFRAAPGERRAERVGGRYQDTMGFTVVGPDRFLGSGPPRRARRAAPVPGPDPHRRRGSELAACLAARQA